MPLNMGNAFQFTAYLFSLILTLILLLNLILVPVSAERFNVSKSHIAGLILARCGSKGIPMKNLAKIGSESLLKRTITTLQLSRRLSSIWVATDCNIIAEEALVSGASVFRRSPQSATDTAPSILAVKEFLSLNPDVRVIALFQCTSPFLAQPFIHSAVSLIHQGYDSVFSVTRQFKLRWNVDSAGHPSASNFNPAHRPRRQDWSGELVENGMFYFISRHLVADGLLQGGRIGVVEIPSNCSLEVDTPADLEVAVSLWSGLVRRGGGGGGGGGSRC